MVPVARKQKAALFERMMTIMVMALAELYPLDKPTPGLVLAYLPKENMFYGSIARYDTVNNKQILLSAKETTLAEVLCELGAAWHRSTTNAQTLAQMARSIVHAPKATRKATKYKRRKKV
jgi:hypothetical protein